MPGPAESSASRKPGTREGNHLGKIGTSGPGRLRQWVSSFATQTERLGLATRQRIALFALAIFLESLTELPGQLLLGIFGQFTPIANMAFPALSFVLLVWAVWPGKNQAPLPVGRLATEVATPRGRVGVWAMRWALVLSLGVGALGVMQVARSISGSFQHHYYTNDGTTLDQWAAIRLIHGQDPYQNSSFIAALRALGQVPAASTPLRLGAFAANSWLEYPTELQLQALALAAPTTTSTGTIGNYAPEFEGQVSYPAFAVLSLVPFVAIGLSSVLLSAVICLALFAWAALRAVDPRARPWLALLILADIPMLNSVLTASLDVTVMLLTFLVWLWWDRPWLATLMLGLDLATKQQAWFFALFFVIFVWRQAGWRPALIRLAGAIAIFVAINLPFFVVDPHAWLRGVLAPLQDPMFPMGRGIVELAVARWIPLWPNHVYTVLELVALLLGLLWYAWRGARTVPILGLMLAMLPLWFAWRSLTSYFDFIALPMLALWLAWYWPNTHRSGLRTRGVEMTGTENSPTPPLDSTLAAPGSSVEIA